VQAAHVALRTPLCEDAKFLAEKYNVSTRLILLMAADNRIPKIRIGRCVRFNEAAVAKVLGG
jgi:excisionase family DNA binding protein